MKNKDNKVSRKAYVAPVVEAMLVDAECLMGISAGGHEQEWETPESAKSLGGSFFQLEFSDEPFMDEEMVSNTTTEFEFSL